MDFVVPQVVIGDGENSRSFVYKLLFLVLELELIHTALTFTLIFIVFFCLSLCFCCCVITCCFSYNSQKKKKKNSVVCLERQQDTIYDHTVIAHCTLQVKPSVIIVQHPTIKVMDKINTLYHYQLGSLPSYDNTRIKRKHTINKQKHQKLTIILTILVVINMKGGLKP